MFGAHCENEFFYEILKMNLNCREIEKEIEFDLNFSDLCTADTSSYCQIINSFDYFYVGII